MSHPLGWKGIYSKGGDVPNKDASCFSFFDLEILYVVTLNLGGDFK